MTDAAVTAVVGGFVTVTTIITGYLLKRDQKKTTETMQEVKQEVNGNAQRKREEIRYLHGEVSRLREMLIAKGIDPDASL